MDRVDSLLFEAAKCERIIYDNPNPLTVNEAILKKVSLYREAGENALALQTLQRIRMFAMSPEARKSVLIERAWLNYLLEDYEASLACLNEAGVEVDYKKSDLLDGWTAMLLTILVPAGYIYVGAPVEGAVSTALNAASVAYIVFQISSGMYISGIVGGAFALNATYLGAQKRVATLVKDRNREALSYSLASALRTFSGLI